MTITGNQGETGSLLVVSTGGFKLFEINGTSVVAYVDIISKAGVRYPTSTVGGGGGGAADGAPGFTLWAATHPTSPIQFGSMTVLGTITSTTGFIVGGSTVNGTMSVKGTGAGTIVGNGIIGFDADGDGSTDTVIAGTSVTITGNQGNTGSLLVVSTGGFKLFEINGTSVIAYVDIISKAGVKYPTSTVGGGTIAETDPAFALFVATGQTQIARIGTEVFQSSRIIPGPFTLTTGTISGTVLVGSVTLRGSLTTTSTVITGDLQAWTTAYTPIGHPITVGVSTGVVYYATMTSYGRLMFEPRLSTASQWGVFEIDLPPGIDPDFDPNLQIFVSVSTGVDPSSHSFTLAVSSVGNPAPNLSDLIYQSTYAVVVSSLTGVDSRTKTLAGSLSLTNWKAVAGNGNRILYVRLINAVSESTCQRYFHTAVISWRRRT